MKVYIIEGWFGDQEWIEAVYENEHDAEVACVNLWSTRSSEKGPEHAQGVMKFAVVEHDVITKEA